MDSITGSLDVWNPKTKETIRSGRNRLKKFELIRSLNGKWQLAPKRASSTAFILCQMEKMCQIAGSKVTFSNLNLRYDQINNRKLVGNQNLWFMTGLIILEVKVKQSAVSNVPIGTMSHFMSTLF